MLFVKSAFFKIHRFFYKRLFKNTEFAKSLRHVYKSYLLFSKERCALLRVTK